MLVVFVMINAYPSMSKLPLVFVMINALISTSKLPFVFVIKRLI